VARKVLPHALSDLIGRPQLGQFVMNILMHVGIIHFAVAAARQATRRGQALGLLRPVAALAGIALQFPADGAAIAAHQSGNLWFRDTFAFQTI
jgi:hypothetical protein